MRIPDLAGLAEAMSLTKPSETPTVSTRKRRNHVRALSIAKQGGSDTTHQTGLPARLAERQTCASGSAFYRCSNGFSGCCATDPCDATNAVCPAVKTTAKAATNTAPKTVTKTGTKTAMPAATTKKATSTKPGTNTATGAANTHTATSLPASNTTPTASNTTITTTITSTASTSPAAQASSSSGTNTGAIVGGVVGGVVGLILLCALIIFCTKRHRKRVDERKAGDKNISRPVMQQPQERYISSGHHRSGSTSHDVYRQGGTSRDPDAKADQFSEFGGHSSTAPGARAEKGTLPAAVLRPAQMLDGTPIPSPKPSSRSSIFKEHISEMPDTSRTSPGPLDPGSPYSRNGESPILGRSDPSSTTSLADQIRRKQHLLSWNSYDAKDAADKESEAMSATLTPRTPPSMRSH